MGLLESPPRRHVTKFCNILTIWTSCNPMSVCSITAVYLQRICSQYCMCTWQTCSAWGIPFKEYAWACQENLTVHVQYIILQVKCSTSREVLCVLKYPSKYSEVCFEVQRSAYFTVLGLHCRRTWDILTFPIWQNISWKHKSKTSSMIQYFTIDCWCTLCAVFTWRVVKWGSFLSFSYVKWMQSFDLWK